MCKQGVQMTPWLIVRCTEGNEQWKYQENPDIFEVDVRQLVSVEPDYEWEIHSRYQKLVLQNYWGIVKIVEARKIPLV